MLFLDVLTVKRSLFLVCVLLRRCRPLGRYVGVCNADLIYNGDYQVTSFSTTTIATTKLNIL